MAELDEKLKPEAETDGESTASPDESARAGSLLVFADDWGRHPSSCQHLIARLLPRYPVQWVNTIGMRPPRLDRVTFRRAMQKLRPWTSNAERTAPLPSNLHVIDPKMWPWFRRGHDRWLNEKMLLRGLRPLVERMARPIVGLTTIPIVADLLGTLKLDRWVYYCVDDFSQWPGLDHRTLALMEERLVNQADVLIAVSETLQAHLEKQGRAAALLTHGVDLAHWQSVPQMSDSNASPWEHCERPLVVFWGLVDQRMDLRLVQELSRRMERGTILFVGPQEHPLPALLETPRVVSLPPVAYEQLPQLAADASVLVMPYADLPVTRLMQPLKLKEYLATGKPVVARKLPAVIPWADCLDAIETPVEFAEAVIHRIANGNDASQASARQRLADESWDAKARQLEQLALTF